eukprot:3545442-Prymnesium_polylepis.1
MASARLGFSPSAPIAGGLGYALGYVTEFSHRTLIGRQDARTLLYNIRSSVEASAGRWFVGPIQARHRNI